MAQKAPPSAPAEKTPKEKAQELITETRDFLRGISLSDTESIPALIRKLDPNPKNTGGAKLNSDALKLANKLTETITSLINQYGISPDYIRLITDLSGLLSDLNIILSLNDPSIQGVQEFRNWEQNPTWDLTLSNSPHVARLTAWKATIWNQRLSASSKAVIRTNPLLKMGVLGIDYRNPQQPNTPTWLAPELTESTFKEIPRNTRRVILTQIAHMMEGIPSKRQKWVAVSLPGENGIIPPPTLWGSPVFEQKPTDQSFPPLLIRIREQASKEPTGDNPIRNTSTGLLAKQR
ncbi:MAG: hypothetical protein WC882_04870 [Candidatus Gracilibacteria bacterium]